MPVILAPLLYPSTDDIPTARLQSDTAIVLPTSMVCTYGLFTNFDVNLDCDLLREQTIASVAG